MKKALLFLLILPFACQESVQSQTSAAPQKVSLAQSLESSIAPPDTLKPFKGLPEYSDSIEQSTLLFPHFQFKLDGQFRLHKNGDTLIIEEMPGQYLYQRRFWLEADSGKTVKSFMSIHESLEQIYPFTNYDPERIPWEEWRKSQQKWQAWSEFEYIPLEGGNFRFPMLNRGHNEEPPEALYKALALRDTFVDIDGEMGGTQAEAIFLGKPAAYYIQKALMRVEQYDDGLLEKEYFILILFSYGC